jgi:hypothetical protein
MRDERVFGLQVEDVVLVDTGGHDHQRALRHLDGARRVLDELHELVFIDHAARSHGEIASDLEHALIGLADAAALDIGHELRQAARQALAARLERLLERLRIGRGEIRRADGVDPLLHGEARALLHARLERRLLHQVLQVARSEQVGLLQVVVVGILAPLAMREAAIPGLGRRDGLAATVEQRAPQLRLFFEISGLQRRVGGEPGCIGGARGRSHHPHPALRQFVARLGDRRQHGFWRPRLHARPILHRTTPIVK